VPTALHLDQIDAEMFSKISEKMWKSARILAYGLKKRIGASIES